MTDVTVLLNRFTRRYRTALITKAALFGVLSLGIAAACWWRLHRLEVSLWWSAGVPSLLTLAAASGLVWWLRSRWISPHAAAGQLDHTLGLQQRLVTTLEFSDAQPPPPLYPLLLEDTTQAFSTQRVLVPRPIDRTVVGLAAILLLLLLWPLKGTAPIRLANLPGISPVTPPPQPQTPPPPRDPPDQRSQQQQQQQQQGQNQQDQKSQQDQQGQQGQQGQQDQQEQQGQQDQQRRQGKRDQQDQQSPQGQQGQEGQQGRQDQQGQQGKLGQQGQEGQQGSDSQALAQQQASPSSSGGGAQGLGNQDALKADIQQLLKELSGELKDLQQQLAQADVQPPQAGTGTDPQLYGAPEPLDRVQGSSVPISLKTDQGTTATQRPGGGVGEASGEISSERPKTKAEAVVLAEESLEETAVTRQRVPPEYQSVFDRLYQRTSQPSETSTE